MRYKEETKGLIFFVEPIKGIKKSFHLWLIMKSPNQENTYSEEWR